MVVFEDTLLGERQKPRRRGSPRARPSRYYGSFVNAGRTRAYGTSLCLLRGGFGRVPSYEDFVMNKERTLDKSATDEDCIGREGS
jgi:hypothetical protein